MKLRVVSRNLWQDVPLQEDFVGVLSSAAGSLFKQVIYLVMEAHFYGYFGIYL